MTPQLNYHPQDTSYGERIVRLETRDETHEDKIDDLGEKIDKLVDVVHDLKTGQEVILAQFRDFEEKCDERTRYAFEVVADYKKTVEHMNDKFESIDNEFKRQTKEIEKGDWLIDWANEATKPKVLITTLFKFVVLPFVIIAAGLSKLHTIDYLPLMKYFGIIR